ncbi:MAG: glycosyltransferase family 1 protein [Aquihabitans sp.]
MRIGIDFRAMQMGHQFRGIGEVVRQSCRQLDQRSPASDAFVAFVDQGGPTVQPILDEVFGPDRSVRTVELPAPANPRVAKLAGALSPERSAIIGAEADVLVQFDFSLGVPEGLPSVVVVYDQVPLLLGDRYPRNYRPTYAGARRAGLGRREAFYKAGTRRVYEKHLVSALERASRVIAISEHTKATTEAFAAEHGVGSVTTKISVARLGHTPPADEHPSLNAMEQARVEALALHEHPFVVFMGGSDERRRVDLLVSAFNAVRAAGLDLKLVLAGYDFNTMDAVLSETARAALLSSSYKHDIHLLGFVSDAERTWLYDRAEAFVFPSEHEGFGLPVIESLAAGCPVVAFANTSIYEVSGPNCLLVDGTWEDLARGITEMVQRPDDEKLQAVEDGRRWAATFTWDTIGDVLRSNLEEIATKR